MTIQLQWTEYDALRKWLDTQSESYGLPPSNAKKKQFYVALADSDYERLCENAEFLNLIKDRQ